MAEKFCPEKSNAAADVQKLLHETAGLFDRIFGSLPVSRRGYILLSCVIRGESSGKPVTPAELSRDFGITRSAVSQQISCMEREGYLRRSFSGSDRRRTYIVSTELGRERAADINVYLSRINNKVKERFGSDRYRLLLELIGEAIGVYAEIAAEESIMYTETRL